MTNEPSIQTIRKLFTRGWHFRVPVYQRAYAWERPEIETLIRDVVSSLDRPAYHVGSLVLHRVSGTYDSHLYDVIDGQQRLTTFFLILSHPALREPLTNLPTSFEFQGSILSFEERSHSTSDLAQLANGHGQGAPQLVDDGIAAAVETIGDLLGTSERLARIMREQTTQSLPPNHKLELHDWLSFLLDNVKITVSELPRETDLNHYFEVMNTRGMQLEKHEVVKAHLIGLLGDDAHARSVFNRVWDAVSDFTRPVQAGFSPDEREQIFGRPGRDVADDCEDLDGLGGWGCFSRVVLATCCAVCLRRTLSFVRWLWNSTTSWTARQRLLAPRPPARWLKMKVGTVRSSIFPIFYCTCCGSSLGAPRCPWTTSSWWSSSRS